MLNYLPFYVLASVAMFHFSEGGIGMLVGPGMYSVENIRKCEGSEEDYLFIFDMVQKKFNRSHDAYDPTVVLKTALDHSYAVVVQINQCVDGGCKLHTVIRDSDVIHFLEEYAKDNVERLLKLAGVDPPKLPVEAGTYEAKDFIFNYEELPDTAVYGHYEAQIQIMDQINTMVGCIELTVKFEQSDS